MGEERSDTGVVLVVTRELDEHMPLIEPELASRGASVARLNTEGFVEDHGLVRFHVAGDGDASAVLRVDGGELRADDIGAVLWHRLHIPTAPDVPAGPARELAESELRATIEGSLLSLPVHWVNHPHANRLARHKLLQLALARAAGLETPETCVTSDPAEVRARFREWGGRMVAKLVGGQVVAHTAEEQHVVHTTMLEEADLGDDAALEACPALYQRYVEKAFELRVTVVGDRLFTCRIDSQSTSEGQIDWRAAGLGTVGLEPFELDADVARLCLALTRRLGLEFAGIDMIVTPEGRTVFLELNAVGTWAWVQDATGLPIAGAIADNLLAGTA